MDHAYHADQMAEALVYLLKAGEGDLSHAKSVAEIAVENYEADLLRRGLRCRHYYLPKEA
jgi:hypothetical protein